jgi:hypothetical protein
MFKVRSCYEYFTSDAKFRTVEMLWDETEGVSEQGAEENIRT